MAETPKTEYVSATYVTLQGQQAILSFARGATLSDMQKELCVAFRKYYPTTQVGLVVDGTVFVELIDKPLLTVPEGKGSIEVIFTLATDMRHIDLCFRGPRRPTFEDDMREGSD